MAHILVVHDGSLLTGLITGSLRDDGHDVTHADDPLAALQLTAEGHRLFDLILTDGVTKPISGFELARRLVIHVGKSFCRVGSCQEFRTIGRDRETIYCAAASGERGKASGVPQSAGTICHLSRLIP